MSYKAHKIYTLHRVVKMLLTFCFITLALFSWGQSKEFVKKNFKDNIKGYKKAMDSIKKGDAYCAKGPHYFRFAISYYLSAEKFNPDNAMLNYKIGKCMIYSTQKMKAAKYLEKAIALNPMITADVHYFLARAYHLNMDWDKAKQEYNTYLQTLTPDKSGVIAEVRRKIQECDNGKQLCQAPIRVFIDNLGSTINTKYPEYHPLISADESKIIYTVRTPVTKKKIDPEDAETFEGIFVSNYKDGAWGTPQDLGAPIDVKLHDATAGLSPDGQTLYIYRTNGNGDIYQTNLSNNGWSKPKRMNDMVNSVGKESSITVSADGKVFYYVSNRPGGYGMGDIYKSTIDANGNWTSPQNLGPTINTQYDELGVYLQPDGSALYFSSTGHNTMGGYDIFKSTYVSGQWSVPENLGYPINTPGDEVYFVMPADKKHAYYSSDQAGGEGDMDNYKITFLGPEKPVVFSSSPASLAGTSNIADVITSQAVIVESNKALLRGVVVDSETHKPLFATIQLMDNKRNKLVATFTTDSTTGNYVVSLSSGINYGISVKANNYLFYSANIDLTDSSHYREIVKNVALQPLEVGSHVALRNIFFDFNRSNLRKESAPELQKVIDLLKQYPAMSIEIAGYTDNKGGAQYNINLSGARAKSVVNYLVAHGISAKRLTSKGYGAANPIATNATDEGRQLNRRTEFKITKK